MKIKKGDTVKVISGKDRGKTAKVLRVETSSGRVVLEGVNQKKKHVRPRAQDKKGEVVLMPAPMSVSAVMLVCPSCQKPTRVGSSTVDGKKVRSCKKCQAQIS